MYLISLINRHVHCIHEFSQLSNNQQTAANCYTSCELKRS